MIAEALGIHWLAKLSSFGQEKRVARLKKALGSVIWGSYGQHNFSFEGFDFTVICGRPFSTGRAGISCRPYLRKTYGISDISDSVQRLCQLVDTAVSHNLIFLAHNGPTGLGADQTSMWGRDFADEGGDHGDADWRAAIEYAKEKGRNVIVVIGGHMHQRTKQGEQRPWHQRIDNTHYINAARVPRIFSKDGQIVHYHVQLELSSAEINVKEMYIPHNG